MSLARVCADEDPSKPEYYTTRVKPIFDANCARCHGGENHRGGLNLDTRAGMLKGMPPKRPKLSDADIAVVERWVKAGAVMPGQ
jgi:mono/diheme cytochrome c family protein